MTILIHPIVYDKVRFVFASILPLSLLTFSNSLDPDQDRQNVVPDLDPNSLTNLIVFL